MRKLIIDTATEALSVALFDGTQLLDHHHEIAGRGHAEKLLPIIAAMANGGRAEEIWVDSGPGSFTGVRVGLAAARALAFAWDARLLAYSSLSLVAAMARAQCIDDSGSIAIALTGGHGELFWRLFENSETLAPIGNSSSTPTSDLAVQIGNHRVFGTGAQALVDARGNGEAVPLHPDARCALLLPASHLSADTSPLYGRGADAALPGSARKRL